MRSHFFSRVRRPLFALFLGSLAFCLWVGQIPSEPYLLKAAIARPDASSLVQQGVQLYQVGDLPGAIAQWQAALKMYHDTQNLTNETVVLENLARAYQQMGQTNQAIDYWEQAIANSRQLDNWQHVGRALTEQAQAYSRIGQQRQAIALLCGDGDECAPKSAVQIAREQQDRLGQAAALGSLGEATRLRGDYSRALKSLQDSLKIAKKIQNRQLQASALNSLGNTTSNLARVNERRAESAQQIGEIEQARQFQETATRQNDQALQYFQESLDLAQAQNNPVGQMRSLLNAIPLYYRQGANRAAAQTVRQARAVLDELPPTREKVYAAIDLTNQLQSGGSPTQCLKPEFHPIASALLQQATSIAEQLADDRALSFALGERGHFYECRQDYEQALSFTRQARWAAEQDLLAADSLYRWEWQTGRILIAQGHASEAIGAYEQAIATLESIRDDLLAANRELQFDFRDTVEPIYRELMALKLETVSSPFTQATADTRTQLTSVLETADSLKLAELQNYFGDECDLRGLERASIDVAGTEMDTAVFSSIILDEQTAIIVSFPDGRKQVSQVPVDRETLREEVNQFRLGLERFFDQYRPQQAQKLYNWLIRPFEDELAQAQIQTLVFAQDGILRSVPMAALHDGEQFLIQKYAVATIPSLSLTVPRPLERQELRALALGLSESVTIDGRGYPPLPYVRQEINQLQQLLEGSKPLLNEEFTPQRLQQELGENAYPVIHIATHGVFGIVPEDTFLVTGSQEKLTISELDDLLRRTSPGDEPIELLTLTACQTAIGDERSALGLAGVALQAGAKSALASLWSIEDAATAQMAERFYRGLSDPNLNRAQALQQAQVTLIEEGEYAHPAYWAPYILIGNWL
ncbi:MAG: CHAT domain-containing protein [Cyanophyceae cyanobacterium]